MSKSFEKGVWSQCCTALFCVIKPQMTESEAKGDQSCKATEETKNASGPTVGFSGMPIQMRILKNLYKIGFFPFSMKVG